jgi:diguanylate cyclase (GGDEF)-like protein/PAS domain S-box-containing protein
VPPRALPYGQSARDGADWARGEGTSLKAIRTWIGRLGMKTKVTLLATAVFLLALALVASVQLYQVQAEITKLLGQQQHGFVARMAAEIDQKLDTNIKAISVVASRLPTEILQDRQALQAWAEERSTLRSLFTEIFVVSKDGEVLVDVPERGRRGINVADQENFRLTVLGGKPYVSRPFLGRAFRQPVVTISAPVFDGEGRVAAVLTGSLNLLQSNFLGNLNEAKVGESGSFSLMTRERMIVISRDKDRMMTAGPPIGASPYFDRAMEGLEGSEVATNSRGLRALYSYTQLVEAPWTLVAALPVEEAFAPVRRAQATVREITILAAGLMALLVWFAVRRLYDPLQAALREREAGLHRAQVMARLGHIVTGPDGEFLSWSDNLPPLFGMQPQQMPATTREWLTRVHADDRERFRNECIRAASAMQRGEIEYRFLRPDGAPVVIHQSLEPLPGGEGAGAVRWFNTLQDVTEQKLAETRIARLNRVYAVLSGINTLIVRAKARDELFREACQIATETGQLPLAWIGLVDRKADKVILAATAGNAEGYVERMPLFLGAASDASAGMARTAVKERRAIVANDIASDPRVLMRKEALERGFRSLVILPLYEGDDVVGVMALYSEQVGFFDEAEMKLLVELAGDLSFALGNIRNTEQVKYLAYYDTLTGLANHALCLERLAQAVSLATRAQDGVGLCIFDIERFKIINDGLGRQAGDALLKQIADRLRSAVSEARIARLGADRFAVLMPDAQSQEELMRRLLRGRDWLEQRPYRLGDAEIRIAVKAGIAVSPTDGNDAEALLRHAEAALKNAKAGGERIVFYRREMTARVAEYLSIENKLRQAIERREFLLHYQPKVLLQTGRIVSVEALIRWNDPERGLVAPGRFIPVLEETGLIGEVGRWALEQTFVDLNAWTKQGLRPPRVAVNVSAIQLQDKAFVDTVIREIVRGGDIPELLELEITESLVMRNVEDTTRKLSILRGMGVAIAIDDFGTGYSSLSYLSRLPVDCLKIDRSFMQGVTAHGDAETLVKTIIALAHGLNLKVVAEGVETEEQAAKLRQLGCDQAQGFLYSKPVPAAELATLLRAEAGVAAAV